MSIRGMTMASVRRTWWKSLREDPSLRATVRNACIAVNDAKTDTEEYARMIELRKLFP